MKKSTLHALVCLLIISLLIPFLPSPVKAIHVFEESSSRTDIDEFISPALDLFIPPFTEDSGARSVSTEPFRPLRSARPVS